LKKLGLGENPLLTTAESTMRAVGHSQLFFAIWEEVEEWSLICAFYKPSPNLAIED
jgi:hypothetical protein